MNTIQLDGIQLEPDGAQMRPESSKLARARAATSATEKLAHTVPFGGDTNCSKRLKKMPTGPTGGQPPLLQRQLTDLALDVGTGQVEGRPVVATLYWTVSIVFAVCVIAVTQAIGGFWDDQDETSFPAKIRAAPAHALRTHEEYYVPSPEVSPTGWLSDQGFLRYSTLVQP